MCGKPSNLCKLWIPTEHFAQVACLVTLVNYLPTFVYLLIKFIVAENYGTDYQLNSSIIDTDNWYHTLREGRNEIFKVVEGL